MQDIIDRAKQVKLVVFDVDGVLTDGGLYIDAEGKESKVFHSRDGHGMKMLRQSGVDVAIISGRSAEAVSHRMRSLGVAHVFQGRDDKLAAFTELLANVGLAADQVAYVGDDVVDLPVLQAVGLAIAVQDAHDMVKRHAHWQTPSSGGRGAAREVCELIMEAQGTLAGQLAGYVGGR